MNIKRFRRLGIILTLTIAVLVACAPLQTSTPTSSSNPNQAASSTSTSNATATNTVNSSTTQTGNTATPGTGSSSSGIKYVLDPSTSSASYAVQEQLASHNLPTMAVGTTNSISGQVVINSDGSIDSANSKFTVDMSALKTDSSMRDSYVAHNILQTSQYPQAVFVPTQTTGLPAVIPQSGTLTYQLTGNLTIRNVTKLVTWDVTGTITNGVATGTATTNFTFEDFSLNQPSVAVVLSVVDKITLTITIGLKAAGN